MFKICLQQETAYYVNAFAIIQSTKSRFVLSGIAEIDYDLEVDSFVISYYSKFSLGFDCHNTFNPVSTNLDKAIIVRYYLRNLFSNTNDKPAMNPAIGAATLFAFSV